jgi:hypothetical protein
MKSTIETAPATSRRDESAQKPVTDALTRYLVERGYARHTVTVYAGHAGHFLRWTTLDRNDLCPIDESRTARFLQDHLRHCKCGWPTRVDSHDARAALGHLLVVLRTLGVIARQPITTTPVSLCRRHCKCL